MERDHRKVCIVIFFYGWDGNMWMWNMCGFLEILSLLYFWDEDIKKKTKKN